VFGNAAQPQDENATVLLQDQQQPMKTEDRAACHGSDGAFELFLAGIEFSEFHRGKFDFHLLFGHRGKDLCYPEETRGYGYETDPPLGRGDAEREPLDCLYWIHTYGGKHQTDHHHEQ
jgi:hypothetical protein